MAKLYKNDIQLTGSVVARNGSTVVYNESLSGFASAHPLLSLLLPTEVYDAATFVASQNRARNVYVSASNELKFNQPDTIEVFELPRLEISNPKFKTRQRKGEIIMSDYRRGNIVAKCNNRLVRSVPTLGSVQWGGWLDLNETYFPGQGAAMRAALLSKIQVRYTSLTFTVRGIHSWKTEQATGLRYESMVLTYPTTYPVHPDPAGVVTSALAEAMSTQMDVLTELVELPQTLAFVNDKCTSAVNLTVRNQRKKARVIRRAKKLKWPTPKLIDRLAAMELQFRYALMPIVYSINDARSLLEEYGYLFKEARSAQHFPVEFSDEFGDWEGNDKVSCLVKQRFDPDAVASRAHALIGPNPIVTLWEITTLSFVVDWVVPIGDYLAALTTPSMSAELKSSLAFRCSRYCRAEASSGLWREIYIESYERQSITPRDHIGLTVSPHMNWKRWLDASALSWSMARTNLKKIKGVRI